MTSSTDLDQIVQNILEDMPLKEKAIIANLDEDKVSYSTKHQTTDNAFDIITSSMV